MDTCKSCRHWKMIGRSQEQELGGICENDEVSDRIEILVHSDIPKVEADGFLVMHSDFGCVFYSSWS